MKFTGNESYLQETTFNPQDYLYEYYSDTGPENLAILSFLVKAFRSIPANSSILEFGGGPTLYSPIAASTKASEIHFCDYSESNLQEIRKWLSKDSNAFDWSQFTKLILRLEDKNVSTQSIVNREEEVRKKITRVMYCDATSSPPVKEVERQYDVLVTNFCIECVTTNKTKWRQAMFNITSLLRANGKLILCTIKGADSYLVGKQALATTNLLENDLTQAILEVGFAKSSLLIKTIPADRPSHTYEGLFLVTATKL